MVPGRNTATVELTSADGVGFRADLPEEAGRVLAGLLNQAVARGELLGPQDGLEAVKQHPLPTYAYYHAARAKLLERLGRIDDTSVAYA